jgi:hypothetical protein
MHNTKTLSFERLDLENVLLKSHEMSNYPIIADFRNLRWVEPFPMLYIASILRDRPDTAIIEGTSADAFSYATFMGFYRTLGLRNGIVMQDPPSKTGYAPITRLDISSITKTAREQRRHPAELLTNHAGNLAAILTQQRDGPAYTIVTYAIRELLRNVIDHSGAQSCWYCAQAWPEKRLVEVAILDQGRGVLESLRENQNLDVTDDESALKLALLPGVTAASSVGRKGYFSNSGYGLYVTKKLCSEGRGSFFVCSMRSGIYTNASELRTYSTYFSGTAVRLQLDLNVLGDESGLIERIVAVGEKEARIASDPRTTAASPASRGLEDS